MKVLFICSQNLLRSPTAEAVFAGRNGMETLSAGTNPDAETPVSADLVEWADVIFVMEGRHRRILNEMFGPALKAKRLVVLDIPDNYEYMDPELVALLEKKVSRHLKLQH